MGSKRRRTGATFRPTPRDHRQPIDFGEHAPLELVRLIENFRDTVNPETRLLIIEFFARSVAVDGDGQQQLLGSLIDTTVTCYFRERYPEGEPES